MGEIILILWRCQVPRNEQLDAMPFDLHLHSIPFKFIFKIEMNEYIMQMLTKFEIKYFTCLKKIIIIYSQLFRVTKNLCQCSGVKSVQPCTCVAVNTTYIEITIYCRSPITIFCVMVEVGNQP